MHFLYYGIRVCALAGTLLQAGCSSNSAVAAGRQLLSSVTGELEVRVLTGTVRMRRQDAAPATASAVIHAARGEYEPFQIVVTAAGGPLRKVNVAVTDLIAQGESIAHSNISIFREHWVEVKCGSPDMGGTNRPLSPGWYPDALIPVNEENRNSKAARFRGAPVDIANGNREIFWFDVFVPVGTKPGLYKGEVTISDETTKHSVPVQLTVWNHVLPEKPTLKSSFGVGRTRRDDPAMIQLLLSHRLMPFLVDPKNEKTARTHGRLNTSGMFFFANSSVRNCTIDPPPSVSRIRAAVTSYPPGVDHYVYVADEIDPCPEMFQGLKAWSRNVHAAGSKVLATVSPQPALFDDGSGHGRPAVDIWVLLPKMHYLSRKRVEEVKTLGGEIWSYNCLVQDPHSPKWQIDFPPINYRIQAGFLNQSLSIRGLLYWQLDSWNKDPWTDPHYRENGNCFPGEGVLVYPGAEAGVQSPLPSMRLKWLREGVEDFEYIEMLKQAGKKEQAMVFAKKAGADWNKWSHDPSVLDKVRLELGEELSKLYAPPSSSNRNKRTAPVKNRL